MHKPCINLFLCIELTLVDTCPSCGTWLLEECTEFKTDSEGLIVSCDRCQDLYPVDSVIILNEAEQVKESGFNALIPL